jgi:hypothetical protein
LQTCNKKRTECIAVQILAAPNGYHIWYPYYRGASAWRSYGLRRVTSARRTAVDAVMRIDPVFVSLLR